jgi:hypothetical protein
VTETLPTPLAEVIDALAAEAQPFRAVHRLIDAIEVLVKLHTAVLVSAFADVVADGKPGLMPPLRRLLAEGLRTPSLGLWWVFAREVGRALAGERVAEPAAGIYACVAKGSALSKALDGDESLIALRNEYAHGATPGDDACAADVARARPRLDRLCAEARWLGEATLIAVTHDGRALRLRGATPTPCVAVEAGEAGHVYLARPGGVLDLHPLLSWRAGARGEGAFFYNDLRSKHASALQYALAERARSKALAEALLRRYPLDDWKEAALDAVEEAALAERIAALTERFKGRRRELAELLGDLGDRRRGFTMLWGTPGVGKSALVARALQYLAWSEEAQRAGYPELRPPRASSREEDADERAEENAPVPPLGDGDEEPARLQLSVARLFVRRGAFADVRELFETLGRQIDRRFGLSIRGAKDAPEAALLLSERVRRAAALLREDQRLVLVIDGLDEAAEHGDFVRGLPRAVPDKVIVMFASRRNPIVQAEVYEQLPPRQRRERELAGLGRDDTLALLYEHVDKYALQPSWIDAIVERGGGNALYLTLLCEALDRGELAINEVARLPRGMAEQYDLLSRRVSATPFAEALLELLTAAHAHLSVELAAELLGVEPGQAQRAIDACAEVLMDDPSTPARDWQLFHESLREYLRDHRAEGVRRAQDRLADWGRDFRGLAGRPQAEAYALRWTATHLAEGRAQATAARSEERAREREDQLLALVEDEAWRRRSLRVCGNAEALRRGIRLSQQIAVARHRAALDDAQGARNPPAIEATRARVARLVEWTWGEERRLYERQRAELRLAHRRRAPGVEEGRWDEVAELARMGTTPAQRALLAALALFGERDARETAPRFGEAAVREIAGWIEEADDTGLRRLWRRLGGPAT